MQVVPAGELQGTEGKRTESPIEEALLTAMLRHQELISVETQYRIRDEQGRIVSRADFAFANIKYAVYCDGKQWHLREDRWHRDLRQRNELTALGWVFSVFSGKQINKDAEECAAQVLRTFRRRSMPME